MARIPSETIDQVRNAADILDIVSQYVDLKRRGRNYFGLCPFHHEKTASFSVAPDKEIYHCFGCGAGGNAINFIMEYEKISFAEAIQKLGERYGIEVKFSQDKEAKEFFEYLYDLHALAVSYYRKNLFSTEGEKIRSYLMGRGLTEETIKRFKLGLATEAWEGLLSQAKKNKFPKDAMEKSGLFLKSDRGTYDRFRSRVIFPIFNTSGKVIAFGGRALDPNDPAKYLNSPETPLYYKSDVFYGLHATRESIRKSGYAILVEGYMDFLQSYQAGITNTVAVSGTALTQRHVSQIRKFTNRLVLAYDGDTAGINAAVRAGYLLLQGGVEPMIAGLPAETDPDDLIRNKGVAAFSELIDKALPLIEFHILVSEAEVMPAAARSQFVREIINNIAAINDGIIRDDLLKTLAQKLRLHEQELAVLMQRARNRSRYTTEPDAKSTRASITFSSQVQKAQLELIKTLAGKDLKARQMVRDNIDLELFTEPLLKKVAELVMPFYDEIEYASILDNFKSKEERETIAKILMEETATLETETVVTECIAALKAFPIKEKIKAARIKIREIEAAGGDPGDAIMEVALLQQELHSL